MKESHEMEKHKAAKMEKQEEASGSLAEGVSMVEQSQLNEQKEVSSARCPRSQSLGQFVTANGGEHARH